MNNAVQHIFFTLLIFVVGSAIFQQNVAQFNHIGSSQSGSKTFCQQFSPQNISDPATKVDPLFEHASKSNADDAQPKTITSCNFLMNLLPAESDFSFNPGEQQLNIGFNNAVLSLQIFVFQEPDPPRLG